jgi:hypothetical protein
MMGGPTTFALRLAVLAAAVFSLIGGAMTLAADRVSAPGAQTGSSKPRTLVVPQVEGQVYVFGKGVLEDSGFAWKVSGRTKGYAANFVVSQSPAAGTVVVDNGRPGTAPLVVLKLTRNPSFRERGAPDDGSPYPGTHAHAASTGG